MTQQKSSFFDNILPAIPVVGSIFSSIINRRRAVEDARRAEQYNSAGAQVARLQAAGLSSSAMYAGADAGSASTPDMTEVDPTLGTAQGMEAYFQNRMQKQQLALMDEQIRNAAAEADVKEGERDWLRTQMPDYNTGTPTTNQQKMLELGKSKLDAERRIKENEDFIRTIEADVQDQLHKNGKLTEEFLANLTSKILQNENLGLDIQDKKLFLQFKRDLANTTGKFGTIGDLIFGYLIGNMRTPRF